MNGGESVFFAALGQSPDRAVLSNLSASWDDAQLHRGLRIPSSDDTSDERVKMGRGGVLGRAVQNKQDRRKPRRVSQ